MTSEMDEMKNIIGNLLKEFAGIISGTANQLLTLSEAIKTAEQKLKSVSTIEDLKPPSVPTPMKLKDEKVIVEEPKDKLSLEKVRLEVPKLLSQLKVLMGTESTDDFSEISEAERKKALKDMEEAIKILTKEYHKVTGSSPNND